MNIKKTYFVKIITSCIIGMLAAALFCFSFAQTLLKQNAVKIEIKLEKDRAYLGDPINTAVMVAFPKETVIKLPEWRKLFENFQLEIKGADKPVIENNTETLAYNFTITPFKLGTLKIPSLELKYILKDGTKGSILTPEKSVKINELVGKDDKEIKDIKPPQNIAYPKHFYLIAAILLFVLIAIVFYAVNLFLKKRKKGVFVYEEIKSPYEIAQGRLRDLKKQNLLSIGLFKEYYTILSEVIRENLEGSFQIPVMDRTTGELYREMKKAIDKSISLPVKDFLEICDLVKFAKFKPETLTAQEDFNKAEEIIEIMRGVNKIL